MSATCYAWIIGSTVFVLAVLGLAARHFRRRDARQRALTALLCD